MHDLTPKPGTVDYPRDTCAKCGDKLCPAGWCVACKKQHDIRQAVSFGLWTGVLVGFVYAAPRFISPALFGSTLGWEVGLLLVLPAVLIVLGARATAKIKRLRQEKEADDERTQIR